MALTATQKSQLRVYLGYPARFHQIQPELEQAFSALEGVPDDEALVVVLLGKLATAVTGVDARLEDAHDRLQASTVGSITLNPGEIGALRSEGRRIVGRIASLMGVTVQADAFSGFRIGNSFEQG